MRDNLWTPARKAELARLLDEGYSFKAIGEKMGLTKGQIAGQAHRLGKSGKTVAAPRKPRPKLRPVPDASAGCRFPMWSSHGRPTHKYCGADCKEESPYCPEHHARCYFKPIPKAKLEAVA